MFGIVFGYYSAKLNKIHMPKIPNNNETNDDNRTQINLTKEQIKDLEEYIDLPINITELNKLNESFIQTKNIQSEIYTIDLYSISNKKYFSLLLSTFDNMTTLASINCKFCNVTNKYNPSLTKKDTKLLDNRNNLNKNQYYKMLTDSFIILSKSIKNGIIIKKNITVDNLIFEVINTNISGFPNSSLIDGVLSLSYNDDTKIPNNNLIMELYNEKKISSPSFTVIITSSNVNRLYLGDILKNDFIKKYINSSMNKGECGIFDNKWQCKTIRLKYTDFIYSASSHTQWAHSTVKFNLKENILTIPEKYYYLLVIGYRYEQEKIYDEYRTVIKYNKWCTTYWGEIYCSCRGLDSFGVITFHFKNNSKLDVDLRDYIYYNKSAFLFKCKVDINLTYKDEFIIGLRGLNNTILSFDLDDKKIEFFHKKKAKSVSKYYWILMLIFWFLVSLACKIIAG